VSPEDVTGAETVARDCAHAKTEMNQKPCRSRGAAITAMWPIQLCRDMMSCLQPLAVVPANAGTH